LLVTPARFTEQQVDLPTPGKRQINTHAMVSLAPPTICGSSTFRCKFENAMAQLQKFQLTILAKLDDTMEASGDATMEVNRLMFLYESKQ
jgi:hypothetical protein